MAEQISERLRWAVDTLAVKPEDHLLEIGCGHGVAVSLICERLEGGRITAIDQSPKMIALAEKRNAAHVAAGRSLFHAVALREADFGAAQFDTIFAIRVGVFVRGDASRELEVVRKHLTTGGRFHLIYDPFHAAEANDVIQKATAQLERHDFTIKAVETKRIAQTTVVCIIAGT